MASPDFDSPWLSSTVESIDQSLNIGKEEDNSTYTIDFLEGIATPVCRSRNIPNPPPLLGKVSPRSNNCTELTKCCLIPEETKDAWDKLFKEGHGADVYIVTDSEEIVQAHYSVVRIASPWLGNFLHQSSVKNGIRYTKIHGVPYGAVYAFIRFLYSSCYEEEEMRKFVLHLLVLSHSYSVPSLKRVCLHLLEHDFLSSENVIDVLQLARNCDASRLCLMCVRMVVNDFKTISSTEGWKVMKRANPALEQELLESVIEADSKKQERLKKIEEEKVYLQLHEAMEALLHICRDGCRTIGPRDKVLKGSQVACGFPACRGLEAVVRHFSSCKTRVPGGCVHCKRMWQLLELHSRLCDEPDYCMVPLCRHFKDKMLLHQNKKEEAKWKLLVSKVIAAKNALGGPITSTRRSKISTISSCFSR